MRYPVISVDRGRALLDEVTRSGRISVGFSEFQSISGAGEYLDLRGIDDLARRLETVRSKHDEDRKTFDADACEELHQSLVDGDHLVDDGFWRWLALGPLREIVIWRFPAKVVAYNDGTEGVSPPNPANFGIGASARQRAECYPYKLWLRAELGRVEEGDQYRYARRGDVDFWTSHIHRQSYTTNRRLSSGLVRFQYPDALDGKAYLHSGQENALKKRFGIRTLAKRIRRLQATYELTLMDAAEIDELISELSSDLTKSGSSAHGV